MGGRKGKLGRGSGDRWGAQENAKAAAALASEHVWRGAPATPLPWSGCSLSRERRTEALKERALAVEPASQLRT